MPDKAVVQLVGSFFAWRRVLLTFWFHPSVGDGRAMRSVGRVPKWTLGQLSDVMKAEFTKRSRLHSSIWIYSENIMDAAIMATISITSNDGTLGSASAVLEVTATNPEYNQPALRIRQVSSCGGAASIRIDDPNPDIEFVETIRAEVWAQ